jgi:hypothetical protein
MEMTPKMMYTVVGIHVPNRFKQASEVQKVLTEYGCSIRTRVGLHEVDKDHCATNGLLLLEMYGEENKLKEMMEKLNTIDRGIEVQQMIFQLKPAKK